ncbi:aminoglycoside adenylyltransferase domain-containing protein [Deinococcus planocerae]|uniref:aminoglycoside adenylyltransferase domain-containing protein n=1 Tax=Deinococcus planocerae TaxID=1737569 RepID=UPI001FE9BECB|nr:aminoglycoside adenylyltransferase domain-containing protein [Deinococcus planocerae]
MLSPPNAEVGALLDRLGADIRHALGDRLVGLYLYGSLVAGDFDPAHSDVDLLAALSSGVGGEDVEGLGRMHARLVEDFPAWNDRIEVDYVPLAALRTFRTEPGVMIRISPGEPLNLLKAGPHYLVNWYTARQSGVALFGPPPLELLPEITRAEFVAGIRGHADAWPQWVTEMHHPGGQAYAVLTLCRALSTVTHGEQVSKRRAGLWAQERLPEWHFLISWALAWRYGGGTQTPDQDHFAETVRFVREVAGRIAAVPPWQDRSD